MAGQSAVAMHVILTAQFINQSTRGFFMLIKQCFVLLFTLAAANMAAAVCNTAIPKTTPDNAFTLHNNGTVTHNKTGLMWMRCELGQTWDGATCSGSSQVYTWSAALQVAEGYAFSGYSDWRVPNKNELASIVELACFNPAINTLAFPDAPASDVWSSSPHAASNSDGALDVYFYNGGVGSKRKTASTSVRLVRGGQ